MCTAWTSQTEYRYHSSMVKIFQIRCVMSDRLSVLAVILMDVRLVHVLYSPPIWIKIKCTSIIAACYSIQWPYLAAMGFELNVITLILILKWDPNRCIWYYVGILKYNHDNQPKYYIFYYCLLYYAAKRPWMLTSVSIENPWQALHLSALSGYWYEMEIFYYISAMHFNKGSH